MSRAAAIGVIAAAIYGIAVGRAAATPGAWDVDDFERYCITADPAKANPSRRSDDNDRVVYCSGYFEGALTTILNFAANETVCLAPGVSPAKVMLATHNWIIKDRTASEGSDLATIMYFAMAETWPCKKGAPR